MENKNYIKFLVVILVIIIFGGIAGLAYEKHAGKSSISNNDLIEAKTITSSTADVSGKIVNINTNAEQSTFIKVNDNSDKQDYVLVTQLDPKSLGLNLGDTIKFSKTLQTNDKKTFFIINNLTDYQIIKKNTNKISDEIKNVKISDINSGMQGTTVNTSGVVQDLTIKNGNAFFKITDDNTSLKAVLFKAEAEQLQARVDLLNDSETSNQKLGFVGKVDIYKGETEIVVSKVYKGSIQKSMLFP